MLVDAQMCYLHSVLIGFISGKFPLKKRSLKAAKVLETLFTEV